MDAITMVYGCQDQVCSLDEQPMEPGEVSLAAGARGFCGNVARMSSDFRQECSVMVRWPSTCTLCLVELWWCLL
jgi:hypothetical protein